MHMILISTLLLYVTVTVSSSSNNPALDFELDTSVTFLFNHLKEQASKVLPTVPEDHFDPSQPFAFIPAYIGSALPSQPLKFSTACFGANVLSATLYPNVMQTVLQASNPNPSCNTDGDLYAVGTIKTLTIIHVNESGTHTHNLSASYNASAEYDWMKRNGVRLFHFPASPKVTMEQIISTVNLFVPEFTPGVGDIGAMRNAEFLKTQVYYNMSLRLIEDVNITQELIHDGDFFGIIRLDGLDPMLAWAMGAHTGHTAIALRFDGELYICESTAKSAYWPRGHVQRTPYSEWIKMAKNASYNVVHLPLSLESRAKFNSTAAQQWFLKTAEGQPYGFFNLLYGWIDTEEDNYPGGLTSTLHEVLVGWVEDLVKPIAEVLWTTALNKRLNTENLTIAEIMQMAYKQNLTFAQLFLLPEEDSWHYFGNLSMVCDVLVCEMYKASGLFGSGTDQIQCTEFTNYDVYALNIFDSKTPRPLACQLADPDLPYCQILGKYRMPLNDYNTRPIYAHMAEKCSRGQPPNWSKPQGC